MNILYLIGNGFDLAQGLNTRYTDFYPHYVGRSVDTPAIKDMCDDIGKDYNTWSDLELRLGEYSEMIGKEDFDAVYFDLCDCLREYLVAETSHHIYSEEELKKIASDLLDPVKYLTGRDGVVIDNMLTSPLNESHHINVISFNYTDVLDKALPVKGNFGSRGGSNVFFDNIFHIHGVLDNTIILGVNDETQIANQDFISDDDIKDLLVKPQANDAIRSVESVRCQNLIEKADIIILFGLSIGGTDRFWWHLIGQRMLANKLVKVVIFKYEDTPMDPTKAQKLGAKRRMVINDFIDKMGVSGIAALNERIYVSFDRTFLMTNRA